MFQFNYKRKVRSPRGVAGQPYQDGTRRRSGAGYGLERQPWSRSPSSRSTLQRACPEGARPSAVANQVSHPIVRLRQSAAEPSAHQYSNLVCPRPIKWCSRVVDERSVVQALDARRRPTNRPPSPVDYEYESYASASEDEQDGYPSIVSAHPRRSSVACPTWNQATGQVRTRTS